MGRVIDREPCPECGSKDNLARYEDGGAKCYGYSCEYYEKSDTEYQPKEKPRVNKKLPQLGEFVAIPQRHISEETCQKMKYSIGSYRVLNEETEEWEEVKAHIVNVADQDGKPVASKIRLKGKQFRYVGDTETAGFVFQDVWPSGCSRKLVVTEGELDALSVSEVQGNKYAVVSLPNGVDSAEGTCARSKDYLMGFEEIVLMFDNDEPGKQAAKDVSRLIGPKAKIAELPLKDANEMLKAGRRSEIVSAVFNAQQHKPDGIVKLSSLKDDLKKEVVLGKPWIYDQLTKATYGRRPGELYFIGAGVGIGKTDFCLQQITADLCDAEHSAVFLLEQPVIETGKRLAGKFARKRFHIPPADGGYTMEELEAAVDALTERGDIDMYNHFGSKDWDTISDTIRWLALGNGVKHFWIDHITALVAHAEDEQKALIEMCADMSSLAEECDINLYVVSHLATPEGKPHEEGGRVMARHFKGSRAIAQWAHYMFGLERNTQAEDLLERQTTTFRIVKDRYTGQATGETFKLGYKVDEGLLYELSAEELAERVPEQDKRARDEEF